MANESKRREKLAKNKRDSYFNVYKEEFISLFHNAVEVENLPDDLPKRYLLKVLMEQGGIAKDIQTSLFLPYVPKGIDVYGLPTSYTLIGYNGYILNRKSNEIIILRANDNKFPIDEYLNQQIGKLVDYDLAIEQNLDAIKITSVAEVSDESQVQSLLNEYNSKRVGSTLVVRNKNSMNGAQLKVSQTGAEYLVDKLRQDRKECLNETLSRLGINVANVDKRERVQDAEIRASQGYAMDSLSVLIDTFNHDAKIGGLDIRLKGHTSLYEQYELDLKKKILENKTLEKGEKSNETNG